MMRERLRTAILISGRGSNMGALIEAARRPDYPAEIALVLSNDPAASGLEAAKAAGIAVAAVDHRIHAHREDFERSMDRLLEIHRIQFLCLAGFMRLLTPWFVARWHGRLINIHPALLPAYKGLRTHERALADGVKIHGCTVHYVVPAVDDGPIVAQAAVPVLDGDTPQTLGRRVLTQEHRIYPLALRLIASGAAVMADGVVRIAAADQEGSRALIQPLDS
ncbi:phosphoribosylglycinamide formyltransferase [Lichenihabitans sp. Uapishka_5]|uniref:phosphoribosylglycinamide formyltransferase n=1 Tax=Lichenihabitans sp. Uapishka_5 TaxID=3037302 RepID=UPI0029E818E3|nr:phosphoribosylglycinamide formyltransferase [Lichenihabitans sp. Uapishka_5]MDX7949643.1 phosphoribosylglycinamide formyltransferase [Lichenihabitans sp. Uapishka_5]